MKVLLLLLTLSSLAFCSPINPTAPSQKSQVEAFGQATGCSTTMCGWSYSLCWYGVGQAGPNNCTVDPCQSRWQGVYCSNQGSVSVVNGLVLAYNGLSGQLPATISGLPDLTDLMLQGNSLQGAIPTQIGLLKKLSTIYLFGNYMSAPLPTELGLLTALQKFDIHGNLFQGGIPPTMKNLANWTLLNAADNDLTGTLPTELAQNPKLQSISLENNKITGTLPAEWSSGSTRTSLQFISLQNNSISGPIPETWANFLSLASLTLNNNQLGCFVPDFIGLGDILVNVVGNPFLCPIPPTLVGQPNSPTCVPTVLDELTPNRTFLDYTGDYVMTGSGFQKLCNLEMYWISSRGVPYTAPVTQTDTSATFKVPAGGLGGAQQYTVELHDVVSKKRLGGVVARITMEAHCPGYTDLTQYPNNGCLHGTCLSNGLCVCERDWQGDKCQLSCTSGNLPNFTCVHGSCFFANGIVPACDCQAGWVGEGCDVELCNPACVFGSCNFTIGQTQGSCICQAGYEGTTCDQEIPCPECETPQVCIRVDPSTGKTYSKPTCGCPNDEILTVEGECLTATEVSDLNAGVAWWVWLLVALGILLVIGIVIFVFIKCRFKPPEEGGEMSKM